MTGDLILNLAVLLSWLFSMLYVMLPITFLSFARVFNWFNFPPVLFILITMSIYLWYKVGTDEMKKIGMALILNPDNIPEDGFINLTRDWFDFDKVQNEYGLNMFSLIFWIWLIN